jgi:hypothetical protein
MEKTRNHQQQSHGCMKKWHRDGINKSERSVGAVVTIQDNAMDVSILKVYWELW